MGIQYFGIFVPSLLKFLAMHTKFGEKFNHPIGAIVCGLN